MLPLSLLRQGQRRRTGRTRLRTELRRGRRDRDNDAERGTMNDSWYDLSGRKLDDMPKAKGIYVVNGQKVMVNQ